MAPQPAAAPSLGLSLGAIEIGALLGSVLYGCLCVQVYNYVLTCSNDRRWVRSHVAFVWVLETLHVILTWMYLYDLTVDGYGKPAILGSMPWPLGTSLYVSSIVGASIQTVFTFRVQTVTHNVWLALPAYINQLSRVAIGITAGILSYSVNDVVVFHDKYLFLVYMNLVPSVVFDTYIAALLCYFLGSHKSPFPSTAAALHRVMITSIETGVITSIVALLTLIFWAAMPSSGIWVAGIMIYAKVYSNSLMVSLNMRGRGKTTPSITTSSGHAQSQAIQITRTFNIDQRTESTRVDNSIALKEMGSKDRSLAFSDLDKA